MSPVPGLNLEAVLLEEPPDAIRRMDIDLASLMVPLQHAAVLVDLVPEVHRHQPFLWVGSVEAEADHGSLPVEGLPLNEPAAVLLQLGDVGEVEGVDAAGGEVPPDAPEGGGLVIPGDEVVEAVAGEVDEAEPLVEVEVSDIRLLQMDAPADLRWLPGEAPLRRPEHVGSVVDAPGLDAGSGELDGEAGGADSQLQGFLSVPVGEFQVEGGVVLGAEEVVEPLGSFPVGHPIILPD